MSPESYSSNLILIISAPSGGGKTTVCEGLLARNKTLCRAITCTTRAPRDGEVNGVDYHFIDESTFETRAKMGAFLEHANVYGRRYGTLQESVVAQLQSGRDVLLNIDVQGAATVRELACKEPWLERGLVTLFMTPPNLEELEQRLRGRGTDSEEVMGRRLAEARREIAVADSFDYLILSGTREMDLQRAEAIYQAERLRMTRVKPAWKEAFR